MLYEILSEELTDNRRSQAKQFNLPRMIYLSIIATLMGANTIKDISIWMNHNIKKKQIKKLFNVEFIKAPSYPSLQKYFAALDHEELEQAFVKWTKTNLDKFGIKTEGELLSADGKVLRGSAHKGKKAFQVLNLILANYGIIVGHKKITDKSNEIPAFYDIIKDLDEGFIYLFDALNTQKKNLDEIENKGAKYVAKVKDNQKSLFNKIDKVSQTKEPCSIYEAPDICQGNQWINRKVSVFTNDSCFYHNGMTHIRSIIKTLKTTQEVDKKTGEIKIKKNISFSIANFRQDAKFFHDTMLKEWKVETMHFFKDTTFREDEHTAYKNPMVFTIIRSFAINTLMFNGVKKVKETIKNLSYCVTDALVKFLKVS